MTKQKAVRAIKPFVMEAAVTALALFVLAVLMLKLEWGTRELELGIPVIYGLASFFGGLSAGAGAGRRRFLRGLGYGGLYFLILCLISLSAGGGMPVDSQRLLTVFGICAGTGMMGGMLSGLKHV